VAVAFRRRGSSGGWNPVCEPLRSIKYIVDASAWAARKLQRTKPKAWS